MNGRELDAAAYAAGLRSGTLEVAKAVLRGTEMVRCEGLNGRDGRQAEGPLLSLNRIPQTIQSRPSCRDPLRTSRPAYSNVRSEGEAVLEADATPRTRRSWSGTADGTYEATGMCITRVGVFSSASLRRARVSSGVQGCPDFGGVFAIVLSCFSSRRGLHAWQPVEGFELWGDLPEEVTA